jgi:hypothetical protein
MQRADVCSIVTAWVIFAVLVFFISSIITCETLPECSFCQKPLEEIEQSSEYEGNGWYWRWMQEDFDQGCPAGWIHPPHGYSGRCYQLVHSWYFWLAFGIALLVYYGEALFRSRGIACTNHTAAENVGYLKSLHATAPIITFHAQCYHTETRTVDVSYRDSNGNLSYRTELTTVTVVTHTASERFDDFTWRDESDAVPWINPATPVRLELSESITYSPEARKKFNFAFAVFKRNNTYDQYQDFTVQSVIPGFTDSISINASVGMRLVFWISVLLLCNVFQRTWYLWVVPLHVVAIRKALH